MHTWFTYLKQGLARTLPDDRIAGQHVYANTWSKLHNLRPFILRHWRKGVFGALFILGTSLLGLLQPLIQRYLIDEVILGRQLGLLAGAILLLAGVKGGGMLTNLWQQFYFTRFQQEVTLDIKQTLFDRTLRFPKSFFDEKEVGYLMSRLSSDVGGLSWFFSGTLVYIISNILRFIGGVALLFYLEWRLACVGVIIIPGLVIVVRYFSGKMRILSHHSMEQHANVSRRMQESLSSVSLIKAFVSEKHEVARMFAEWRAAFQLALEQMTVNSVANLAITLPGEVARLVVYIVGVYEIIAGDWTLGSLLAFQSYLGYVYGPAQFLASSNLQLQNALAALERVSALFDIVPEENVATGRKVERLQGEIEFKQVSFAYNSSEPVLKDVSCRIAPGEHVAIVGPSGVGKTTLISLILRFYQPTQGEIWFDGQPASDYELSSLRQRIGYVSQSTLLLSGTMLDNLRYGNPAADPDTVIHAAQVAGIHEFIASLPQGYDSPVGERGVNLSEGQKQRLAIARALIKDPDVLVLDEPTSALDSIVEKSIFDVLPVLVRDKTMFVVAHRLATVQHADRILVFNEQRLIAMGTHTELLENNGYYRSLVANQQLMTS